MLHVESIQKYFGNTCVLSDVSFTLPAGSIGCLLGASGCGKTTLLRIVAGFEEIAKGSLSIDGRTVSSDSSHLAPESRDIGMVFQDYALFPHLTVRQNVAFGLTCGRFFSKNIAPEAEKRIDVMLELVGLSKNVHAYPHELSGGQQQRVALARALAPKPKLLLMDEPFSNLDIALRERLSVEMRSILKQENITALMVTHNQSEAFAMGDYIGVMNEGILHQWASPADVYQQPCTTFVAEFIGEGSIISGKLNSSVIQTAIGDVAVSSSSILSSSDGITSLLIRPEQVSISTTAFGSGIEYFGIVEQILFRGACQHCFVRLQNNETLAVNAPVATSLVEGQKIFLKLAL